MIIYRGYYYFKKGYLENSEKSHVFKLEKEFQPKIPEWHGSLRCLGGSFFIHINEEDSLEEQVKTVLHELAHIGLEYEEDKKLEFLKNDVTREKYHEIDKTVEMHAKEFYQRNPEFVKYLKNKISDNKKLIYI